MTFFVRFSKYTERSNFIKIIPVKAELLHSDVHTDGQTKRGTEKTNLIVDFLSYPKASKTA
jgi:hypothetical protein